MNKTGLVEAIALKANVSKAEAAKVLDAAIEAVVDGLKKEGKVELVGFASLKVAERAARTGINPLTKQAINIPAKKVVKFKAGSKLAF
ncbi:MAG: HU family DNA-binding protein [Paludibacteraceae bacterium]|nr:HU family DNA-binding protein [Paludibacteraceae bacterium]